MKSRPGQGLTVISKKIRPKQNDHASRRTQRSPHTRREQHPPTPTPTSPPPRPAPPPPQPHTRREQHHPKALSRATHDGMIVTARRGTSHWPSNGRNSTAPLTANGFSRAFSTGVF